MTEEDKQVLKNKYKIDVDSTNEEEILKHLDSIIKNNYRIIGLKEYKISILKQQLDNKLKQ